MMDTDATTTAGTDMAIVVVVGVGASQDTDGRGIIAATTATTVSKTWVT